MAGSGPGDLGRIDRAAWFSSFSPAASSDAINRRRMKVAPAGDSRRGRLASGASAQAAAFALPHPTLGEDVAAAVVLQPERNGGSRRLTQFRAHAQLAAFKVPTRDHGASPSCPGDHRSTSVSATSLRGLAASSTSTRVRPAARWNSSPGGRADLRRCPGRRTRRRSRQFLSSSEAIPLRAMRALGLIESMYRGNDGSRSALSEADGAALAGRDPRSGGPRPGTRPPIHRASRAYLGTT